MELAYVALNVVLYMFIQMITEMQITNIKTTIEISIRVEFRQ